MCFLLASHREQWKMIRQVPRSHICAWLQIQIYTAIHVSYESDRFSKNLKRTHISLYSPELQSQVTLRVKNAGKYTSLINQSQSITACINRFRAILESHTLLLDLLYWLAGKFDILSDQDFSMCTQLTISQSLYTIFSIKASSGVKRAGNKDRLDN